jgi:hypothetical protein
MCGPVYRDVLVWQDQQGQPLRWAEFCFDCDIYLYSAATHPAVIIEEGRPNPYQEVTQELRRSFTAFDQEAAFVRKVPLL